MWLEDVTVKSCLQKLQQAVNSPVDDPGSRVISGEADGGVVTFSFTGVDGVTDDRVQEVVGAISALRDIETMLEGCEPGRYRTNLSGNLHRASGMGEDHQ